MLLHMYAHTYGHGVIRIELWEHRVGMLSHFIFTDVFLMKWMQKALLVSCMHIYMCLQLYCLCIAICVRKGGCVGGGMYAAIVVFTCIVVYSVNHGRQYVQSRNSYWGSFIIKILSAVGEERSLPTVLKSQF